MYDFQSRINIKYTFLLPAYKSKFLDKSLKSILSQTYRYFKAIVSDDCSPENIKSVYNKCVGNDPRFTYSRNVENIGGKSLVEHWNILVNQCETEYLILASDDDIYAPNFLEEIDKLIERHPNCDLYRGRVQRIDGVGNVTEEDSIDEEYSNQIDFLFNLFCRYRIKCVGNYVWKTSALKNSGSFVEFPLAWGSDDATVRNLSKKGVCTTFPVVFSFRCSEDNISGKNDRVIRQKKVQAKFMNLKNIENFASQTKMDQSILLKNRWNSFLHTYISECEMQMMMNSCVLSFKEMWHNFIFLIKRGRMPYLLERLQFLWLWLKNR